MPRVGESSQDGAYWNAPLDSECPNDPLDSECPNDPQPPSTKTP